MSALILREATAGDADLLYAWRNAPDTRENSFNTDLVDPEVHRRWFAAKLVSRQDTRIWILTEAGIDVGQVRYERRDRIAETSISIDARCRGRGLGTAILKLSAARACQELHVDQLRALIRVTNMPSMIAFERAGFRRDDDCTVGDDRAAVFVWRCGGY